MTRTVLDTNITSVRTVCSYCGVGCGIVLDVAVDESGRRRVVRTSGDKAHPANRGRLCSKGATTTEMLAAPGRLTTALRRTSRGSEPEPIDVDLAISDVAARLRRLLDEHGPDALSFYVSGQLSLEAQYLITKLARGFVRTNQLESNSRLCMASAASGYKLSLGADGPPGSYDDLDHADVFFVIGANMADCHPVLFLRMMDRVKAGAKLIVVDPRRTATADQADLQLQLRPGTDLALLNGLLHLLVSNGQIDEAFIAEFTEGWEAMPGFLADYSPSRVAAITGVPERDIRSAAAWIGDADNWMSLWTMGLNQSTHGTWNTNALCNVHLATGAICRRGAGPFSLTGQPNAMGGREMGYLGDGLPGQRTITVEKDRGFIERLWSVPAGTISAEAGPGTVDLFARMAAGEIKACWILCTNPVASVANRKTVIDGLEAAELVITQDVFADTETNEYADLVLPAAMWAESEGVFVNSERSLTLAQSAVDAPGQALPDWQLIARVACEMGFAEAFSYCSSQEIFEEIRQASNPDTGYDLRGIDYERLRSHPVQWPSAPGDFDSTRAGAGRSPIRYHNDGVSQRFVTRPDGSVPRLAFPTESGRARFFARPHVPIGELPDTRFPFVLNTGRLQHQWHTLTKTGKLATLTKLNPGPFVELNPQDAAALGVGEGDIIEVASRRGRAMLPAAVSGRVQPGTCFAPFHWNDQFGEYLSINAVTNDAVDPISSQPEFKACAVSLTRVSAAPATARTAATPSLDTAIGAPGQRTALILWASQTGTAESFAEVASRRLGDGGAAVALRCMAEHTAEPIPEHSDVLLITSTFGDGESPDNGKAFWERLLRHDAGELTDVRYAVLAFGDSSYREFCGHGKRLDRRLEELGGTRLAPRVDCDGFDTAAAHAWLDGVGATLHGSSMPHKATGAAGGRPPRMPNIVHARDTAGAAARLVGNRLLNGPGSEREVRHFTFDISESGLAYQAGDILEVVASNSESLVDEWLLATGLDADETVDVPNIGAVRVAEALGSHLEITKPSPELLRFLAQRSADRRIRLILERADRIELDKWLWGRQAVDVLNDVGNTRHRATAQQWVDLLKPLRPRRYSIASSPDRAPELLQILVSIVRFENVRGRERRGVCSAHLLDAALGQRVGVAIRRNRHFRPPQDTDTPAIMIGAGTGIAPFLGFLDERQLRGASGKNWLFFGEQHEATDFYFRDELTAMKRDGVLTRLDVAFSRDQRTKIYVQDRIREHRAELWSWLRSGAHIYVCGDAARMAKDVDDALCEVISHHGAMTRERAAGWLRQLIADHRYVRDVY